MGCGMKIIFLQIRKILKSLKNMLFTNVQESQYQRSGVSLCFSDIPDFIRSSRNLSNYFRIIFCPMFWPFWYCQQGFPHLPIKLFPRIHFLVFFIYQIFNLFKYFDVLRNLYYPLMQAFLISWENCESSRFWVLLSFNPNKLLEKTLFILFPKDKSRKHKTKSSLRPTA